jgi:hypothetical protein
MSGMASQNNMRSTKPVCDRACPVHGCMCVCFYCYIPNSGACFDHLHLPQRPKKSMLQASSHQEHDIQQEERHELHESGNQHVLIMKREVKSLVVTVPPRHNAKIPKISFWDG